MSVRQFAIVLAVAATAATAAYAGPSTGTGTFVQGEIGYTDSPVQSIRSRQDVLAELQSFRSNPLAADGARYVGGEMGYAYVPHTHEFRDGKWIALSGIGHNPKPAAIMGDSERRQFTELYPAR